MGGGESGDGSGEGKGRGKGLLTAAKADYTMIALHEDRFA